MTSRCGVVAASISSFSANAAAYGCRAATASRLSRSGSHTPTTLTLPPTSAARSAGRCALVAAEPMPTTATLSGPPRRCSAGKRIPQRGDRFVGALLGEDERWVESNFRHIADDQDPGIEAAAEEAQAEVASGQPPGRRVDEVEPEHHAQPPVAGHERRRRLEGHVALGEAAGGAVDLVVEARRL